MVNILFIQIDKSQHAIFFTSSSLIGINGDFKEKFQVQGTQKEILQPGRGNVTPLADHNFIRFYIHLTHCRESSWSEGRAENAAKHSCKRSLGLNQVFCKRVWNLCFSTGTQDEKEFSWRGWVLSLSPLWKAARHAFKANIFWNPNPIQVTLSLTKWYMGSIHKAFEQMKV